MGEEVVKVGKKHPKRFVEKCMLTYITTDLTLGQVADEMGVSRNTLYEWSRKGKWKLFRGKLSDKFEGLMSLSQDRVAFFEHIVREFYELMGETDDIREKAIVIDTVLKVDRRISEWLLLGNTE